MLRSGDRGRRNVRREKNFSSSGVFVNELGHVVNGAVDYEPGRVGGRVLLDLLEREGLGQRE